MNAWYELKVAGYSVGMTMKLSEVTDWYAKSTHRDRQVYKMVAGRKSPITVDNRRGIEQ
jgi:hypothetical protein